MKNNRVHIVGGTAHLVVTGAVGFVWFLVGQLLYTVLTEKLWTPLGIALYFLGFAVLEYVAMWVLNQIRRDYSYWYKKNKLDEYHRYYRDGAICLLVIFVLAGAFEFLYELGGETAVTPTSYIFLIDDSGSMSSSDPDNARERAIYEIMDSQTSMPYAVYSFTGEAVLQKNMGAYSSADTFVFDSDGGTDVIHALNMVLDDIVSGKLNAGASPRILLLSDGESSSLGWRSAVQKACSNNVIISAVAYRHNSNLLNNLAEKTGGVCVRADDIQSIAAQMQTAITSLASRNLISTRYMQHRSGLYGVMRIVFLILVGIAWSIMKFNTYCSADGDKTFRVLWLSLIFVVISSVLMEFLLQVVDILPWMARCIFCVLWAITPGFFVVDNKTTFSGGNPGGISGGNGTGSNYLPGKELKAPGESTTGVKELGKGSMPSTKVPGTTKASGNDKYADWFPK